MKAPHIEADRIANCNSNTAITGHEDFDRLGCLVIKDLYDTTQLIEMPPNERGKILYEGDMYHFQHIPNEGQVEGSLSRYNYPKYKQIHTEIRKRLEKIIGKKLFNTYYYDRFYFNNQELVRHIDRDSCEISLSLHIASNPENIEWPFWVKTAEGYEESAILKSGDGLLYKGCELPHWRNKLVVNRKKSFFNFKNNDNDVWYHQIFFHYVLADGHRVQFAGDKR